MSNKEAENTLSEEYYGNFKLPLGRLARWSLGLFFIGFFLNLSLHNFMSSTVADVLRKTAGNMTFSKVEYSAFLPKIIIHNPSLPLPDNERMALDKVYFKFRGISLWPLGIKFLLDTKIGNESDLEVYTILSFGKVILRMEDNELHLKDFAQYFPKLAGLEGMLEVNLQSENSYNAVTRGKLSDIYFKVESENFKFRYLKIKQLPFEFPYMEINSVIAQGVVEKKGIETVVNLEKKGKDTENGIKLGDAKSPLKAEFHGKININGKKVAGDLEMKIKGTGEVGEIIDNAMALKGVQKTGGMYRDKIVFK